MSYMKDLFLEKMEHLAAKTGYSVEFLLEMYDAYNQECMEAGEDFDWSYFCGVTLQKDW